MSHSVFSNTQNSEFSPKNGHFYSFQKQLSHIVSLGITLVRLLHTFCIISKLHNHRRVENCRDLCRPSSLAHLLKAGSVTMCCHVQSGFENLQGWILHNLSRQPVTVFDHLQSKSVFLCLNHVLNFVFIVSCSFTEHH